MYYEKYKDNRGEWRWTFHAANGEAIGVSSEGYVREDACDRSITLMKGSTNAPIRKR